MQTTANPSHGLRLYDYAASANCYKVRLLLTQLARPYERVPVDIFAGDTLTDTYAALNPARETPVLQTEDGRCLPDSSAILVYLADSTPFMPSDALDRADVVRWLVYEQTVVIPTIGGLRFRLLSGRLSADDEGAIARARGAAVALGLLDEHLAGREFFAGGRYSVADIALYAYIHVAGEANIDLQPYANVGTWLERVSSQAGYMNDLEPYPATAREGAGRSIYD